MPVTVSWTIDDAVIAALDAYRKTLYDMRMDPTTGAMVPVLRYETIRQMVFVILRNHLVRPALAAFPSANVATLAAQRQAAEDALQAGLVAAEQAAISTAP